MVETGVDVGAHTHTRTHTYMYIYIYNSVSLVSLSLSLQIYLSTVYNSIDDILDDRYIMIYIYICQSCGVCERDSIDVN